MGLKKRVLSIAAATAIVALALAVPVSANHLSNGQFYAYSTQLVWKYCPGYGWLLTRTVQPRQPLAAPIRVPTAPTQPAPTQPAPTQPAPTQPAPTQPAPTQPAPTPGVAGLTADEQQMLNSVNNERSRNGLAPLQADLQLTKLARMKSQDMISGNYFSHQSPTYGSPFDLLATYGVTYRSAGENIAGNGSVSGAHTSLMNSSGHRANILNSRFTHVGIGIVKGGNYGMMFTQLFIGK